MNSQNEYEIFFYGRRGWGLKINSVRDLRSDLGINTEPEILQKFLSPCLTVLKETPAVLIIKQK